MFSKVCNWNSVSVKLCCENKFFLFSWKSDVNENGSFNYHTTHKIDQKLPKKGDSATATYCVLTGDSGPGWNSARLSRLRNSKSRLFKKFVRSSTDIDYALCAMARADYRRLNHYCYKEYMIRVRSNLASFPKSFYDFVLR